MPSCHFLLIVIVIAVMLIYAEFFKNMEKSKMLFRIGFVKLLIFHLFSKVIQCNAEVIYGDCKNWYMKEHSLKEKYLPWITLKESQSFLEIVKPTHKMFKNYSSIFRHIQNPGVCKIRNQDIQNPVRHQWWSILRKLLTAIVVFANYICNISFSNCLLFF